MKKLFWPCALLIVFAQAVYPACFYFRARFWPRHMRRANIFPIIPTLLAACNEGVNLARNIPNFDGLDYPVNQPEQWLLTIRNPARFQFFCHQVLRLAVPFAVACLLISSLS